jgi:16S rRNA (guanine(966)-N(2))-methyltransferase RsmD
LIVRVISGKAKGKKLKAPSRARPLTDRVKEALFNILSSRTADGCFLDLFAGSGAVGIEALSRGARRAVFVELDRKAVKVIRENLDNVGFSGQADVYAVDILRALDLLERKAEKFDIIFLGAPYDSPELEKGLIKLGAGALVAASGLIIAEHRKQHLLAQEYGSFHAFREAKYGETVLTFYESRDLSR